jgi:hypothetical protein
VFWHPKGWSIWQVVEQYMRGVYRASGYQEVRCPMILDVSLWQKSGHWDNYKDNMFFTESEKHTYAVKPMNCPGHVQVFNQGLHSYRDLPIRYGEFGACHRNEPSGALHGILRARPTLSVTLDAERTGSRPLTLSYLTPGLGWQSDYVALFDERAGKIDVQGWITLTNNTGTTFTGARTLLVAGNVGQVQQGYNPRFGSRMPPPPPRGNVPGTETGNRERLGDFYVYPIEGRTTIANAQTKQVSFLDASGVPARKGYEFQNPWLGAKSEGQSAASVLKFSSARSGGIGDALPAGTVRVYMRDARGQAQFIGESGIPHTPGGSSLALRTGDAFDVKVQPVVEKREPVTYDVWRSYSAWQVTYRDGKATESYVEGGYTVPRTFYRTQMKYVVTNAKPEPVTVDVVQNGLGQWWWWRGLRIGDESIKGVQENFDTRRWDVPVPANGKTELTVTFITPW